MNGFKIRVLCGTIGALLLSAACAGTRLNDVGDVNGGGGGSESNGGEPSPGGEPNGGRTPGGGGSLIAAAGKPSGGSGGTSTIGEPGGEGGGDSGDPGSVEFSCPACEPLLATPDIRAVWIANDQVYWIEYGGFDALGNYEDDGKLRSVPLAGGEPQLIAASLGAPIQLAVSERFAYVIEEHSGAPEGEVELTRVALDTGEAEALQALPSDLDHPSSAYRLHDWMHRSFTVSADVAYWQKGGVIYRSSELNDDGAGVFFTPEHELLNLLSDDTRLLMLDYTGLAGVPLVGGSATPIWASSTAPSFDLVRLNDDGYIYGLEFSNPTYLARLQPETGSYKRMAKAWTEWPARLRVNGAAYVADGPPSDATWDNATSIGEGLVADRSAHHVIAVAPSWVDGGDQVQHSWRAWDATDTAVYLGYENELYRVARQ